MMTEALVYMSKLQVLGHSDVTMHSSHTVALLACAGEYGSAACVACGCGVAQLAASEVYIAGHQQQGKGPHPLVLSERRRHLRHVYCLLVPLAFQGGGDLHPTLQLDAQLSSKKPKGISAHDWRKVMDM